MKIKELQKTVNICWSPENLNDLYLAAGTAAQQIDASLNSSATLEVYGIDLKDPGYDLVLKASQTSPYRFQKVVWSPLGINGNHANGVIVGGCESGHLLLYSAEKLLLGEDALLVSQDKHTGAVRALDYNPFQTNLLASGASESDILIWDLNNTNTPMTPGNKTQPLEDIQNIAWNRQVQHILASVFSSRCVIWDLRKNEPIIKLCDTQSRVKFRAMQWHPSIATQIWLASEDDQAPVVQLWDLRYATAPTKTMQIHQRGILGLTWCPKDIDLMVSCGKDNKILCWNPNTEQAGDEIISEIASTIQWYSDVQWCPRNPALIASSSFDGAVSVYSLYGGTQQQVQTSNKIADSFPGMDQFAQAPVPQSTTQVHYSDLKRPAKWLKRPIGAKFGFGGKLVTFQNDPNLNHKVNILQVVTDTELIDRSTKLEEMLSNGNYIDYCRQKADETQDQHNRYVWYFLKANFENDPKAEMLNLLGYNQEDIKTKFKQIVEKTNEDDIDIISNKLADLGRSDSSEVEGDYNVSISTTTNESTDYSTTDNAAVFDSIGRKLNDSNDESTFKIHTGEDSEGLICQALLTGNIEAAVELCLESNRTADAIIIASTGGPELLSKTQYRYLKRSQSYISNIISAIIMDDLSSVISQCTTDSWKEALVAALTHGRDHTSSFCESLGQRLQSESGTNLSIIQSAILCYICAGSVEHLAEAWMAAQPDSTLSSTKELQDLIEVIVLLQKALELHGRNTNATGKLADLLTRYASLLAAQGALNSALAYLGPSDDSDIIELRERLYYALGHKQAFAVRGASQAQTNYAKSQTLHRFSQPRVSLTNNTFNPLQQTAQLNNSVSNAVPPVVQTASPPQIWNTAPTTNNQQSWNQTAFSSNPQVVKPPLIPTQSVPENLPHPPRPSSVSSQGSAAPITSRSKYVLDPSVQSSAGYGQTNNYNNPMQPNPFHGSPIYGQTQPNNVPTYNQFNTMPFTGGNSFNNNQTNTSIFNPTSVSTLAPNLPPVELAQSALQQQQIQRNPTPPPGWNDPPALKSSRPVRAPSVDTTQNSVITHPLFANDPHAQQQNGYGDVSNSGYPYMTPQIPTMQHQPIPAANDIFQPQFQANVNQSSPQSFQTNYQQNVPQQQMSPPPPVLEVPKAKAPIPEEYVYMQTVFNELKTQCINAATNPQIKRKLDDVGKRFESLYDLLREYRLTPNTLDSLNKLVQLVQVGDYANGLGLHTQMVSGTDFAQIASFMPGIKVLLQTAMQLQVYLQ